MKPLVQAESGGLQAPTRLRALIVEDLEHDTEILVSQLRKGWTEVEYERVVSEQAMRQELARGRWDIVLCDYRIPGFGAPAALQLLRAMRLDLPFIVVSAIVAEEAAADLLDLGIDDFITKGRYARLVPAIRRALGAAQARAARTQAEYSLDLQRRIDPVTALATRPALFHRLREALAQREAGSSVAVLAVRLDRLTRVSESFGHEAADVLLRDIADRLRRWLPEGGLLARIGDDELAAVVVGDVDAAKQLADRMIAALDGPFVVGTQGLHVTATIGAAVGPEHGTDAVGLLHRAGAAQRRAKHRGLTAALVASDQDASDDFDVAAIEEVRTAIDRGELELHYQPKIDARSSLVSGVEALVRWRHPSRGLVSPAVFLPLVHEGGLGRRLTQWVLDQALSQGRAWQMAGFNVPVAVNLTMDDAQDAALPDRVSELLARHELAAETLELELTEDTAMTDPALVDATLRRLDGLGVGLTIDDFGTGYSSLTYLQRLPVERLKIDRSFIANVLTRDADAAIVRSAVQLGHQLGLRLVAEGVEDEATWRFLRELGCDEAQGFLFARPLPFLELARWFANSPLGVAATDTQRSHAAGMLALAEGAAEEGLAAERRRERLDRLEREKHNLSLALSGSIDRGDADTALRLASALRFYWVDHGKVAEGMQFLERALALRGGEAPTRARAGALNALAVLEGQREEYARARPLLVEASRIQRQIGDERGLAASLNNLGLILDMLGALKEAEEAYLESLGLRRTLGDRDGEALTLDNLATNAYHQGDLAGAHSFATEGLVIHRADGDRYGIAVAMDTLGAIAIDRNDPPTALACYRESLALYAELSVTGDASQPMAGIAIVAAATGARLLALTLAGAIEMLRERYSALPPINEPRYARCLLELEQTVAAAERETARIGGRSLSIQQAFDLALGFAPASPVTGSM